MQEELPSDSALLLPYFLDLKGFILKGKMQASLAGLPAQVCFALLRWFCTNVEDPEKRSILYKLILLDFPVDLGRMDFSMGRSFIQIFFSTFVLTMVPGSSNNTYRMERGS